jgi:trigger factor
MQLQQQGIDMAQYFDMTNSNEDALRENMKEDALMRVKTGLLFDAIEAVEDIEVTDEDIQQEYEKMAEQQDKSVEEIKELFGGNDDYLKDSLKSRKIVDFLVDEAEIVE